MIITCPACTTRYMVTAESLAPSGRMVRCAKCSHKWLQEFIADDNDVPSSKNEAEPSVSQIESPAIPSALPVKIKPYKISASFYAAVAVSFILAVVSILIGARAQIISVAEWSGHLYGAFGMQSTEGLELTEVQITRLPNPSRYVYLVQGKIINNSEEGRKIPILKISAQDSEGDLIRSWEYEKPGEVLEPTQSFPFQTQVSFSSSKAASVVLDIGNFLELSY